MECSIDMLPGQTVCSFPLPVCMPQTFCFYSGVYTTGIGDTVSWKVDLDLFWNSHNKNIHHFFVDRTNDVW